MRKAFFYLSILLIARTAIAQEADTVILKDGTRFPCHIVFEGDIDIVYNEILPTGGYSKEKFKVKVRKVERVIITETEHAEYLRNLYITGGENDVLTYSEVVQIDSTTSKDELFERARKWFTKAFVSSKDVIQIIDKGTGQITAQGIFTYYPKQLMSSESMTGPIRFTTNIYVKDGRYKYEFTDFIHIGNFTNGSSPIGIITNAKQFPYETNWNTAPAGWCQKHWEEMKNQIYSVIEPLRLSLKQSMSEKVNNDW